VPQMREARWRLVNRDVRNGLVRLDAGDVDELLRERIRVILHRQLPLRVPPGICEHLAAAAGEITTLFQEQILVQFGEVSEEAFPPCISALIHAITAGTNLTHMGRFAITAFCHTIGMSTTEIAEIFARAPDFDLERTMYQVEHISGRSGTEYTPPSCATMRTFGLCTNREKQCEKVNHPLTYYRIRKNQKKKSG
jgi:DNA primase large subunit